MRFALASVLASVLATAGAAAAQVPVGQPAVAQAAYTVEPFTPSTPVTIQGQGVRLRAEPFTGQTPVLSSGSTGLELTVVGLVRMSDWAWYQVVLRNGQKAFIRSDLTSAPLAGGTRQVAVAPPAPQPNIRTSPQPGAITMTPPPAPREVPAPQPAPSIALPLPAGPAPAPSPAPGPEPVNNGLISIAPVAPTPHLSASGSLGDHVMAQLVDKRCWSDSSSMMDAQRLKATFSLDFGMDGRLAAEPVLIEPALAPTDDPAMTVFIAKARAALRTCNALGFDIPASFGARSDVRVQFKAR